MALVLRKNDELKWEGVGGGGEGKKKKKKQRDREMWNDAEKEILRSPVEIARSTTVERKVYTTSR